jgi:hypothetical protein
MGWSRDSPADPSQGPGLNVRGQTTWNFAFFSMGRLTAVAASDNLTYTKLEILHGTLAADCDSWMRRASTGGPGHPFTGDFSMSMVSSTVGTGLEIAGGGSAVSLVGRAGDRAPRWKTAERRSTRMAQFNALFERPQERHAEICMALQEMVTRVATLVRFSSRQRREEITRDVYLYCLEQVTVFETAGASGRRNALRWFGLVARREFWTRVRTERARRMYSLNDVDHDTARLRAVPRVLRHASAPGKALAHGRTRTRIADDIDGMLDRAVMRYRTARGDEVKVTRGMVLALQEVRKRITGKYRRMQEAEMRYGETHRLEKGEEEAG